MQDKKALRRPEIASLLGLPKDYEELSIADLRSDTEALKEEIHQLFCDFDSEYASPWERLYDHRDLKKIEMPEEADDFYDARSEEQDDDPTFYDAQSGLVKKDESYFGDLKLCQQSLRMLDQLVFMTIKTLSKDLVYNVLLSEVTSLDGLFCWGDPKLGYYAKSFSIDTEFGREDMIHIIQADNTELCSFWQKNAELDGQERKDIVEPFFHMVSTIGSTAMLDLVRKEVEDINVPDESGNTALVNTFNLPYMEMMGTRSVFNESNFDYLIKKGAKVSTESLQTAMMFANLIEDEGEKKYEKIFEKLIDAGVNPVSEGVDIIAWASSQNIRQPIIDVVEEVIARKQPGPSVSP